MEYTVIVNDFSINRFILDVNIKIGEGWNPVGGVSVSMGQSRTIYSQAMIRNKLPTGGRSKSSSKQYYY